MGEGFQFIDIILFAMVAAFLVLRLRNVLGRRNGHEGGYRDPFRRGVTDEKAETPEKAEAGKVVTLPDQSDAATEAERGPKRAEDPLAAGIFQIRVLDSRFDPDDFVAGARVAFEMILGAYAAGDEKTLKPLVSPEVFSNFSRSIRERQKAHQTLEETLVGIKRAEIVEAYLEKTTAYCTVKFVSEQINATRDERGEVVDGDPEVIAEVTDFWTFARDTKSRDPNWTLVATRSPE